MKTLFPALVATFLVSLSSRARADERRQLADEVRKAKLVRVVAVAGTATGAAVTVFGMVEALDTSPRCGGSFCVDLHREEGALFAALGGMMTTVGVIGILVANDRIEAAEAKLSVMPTAGGAVATLRF